MPRIINGSQINSSHVSPSARYLDGRRTDVLREVGALTAAEAEVARRIDGTIANRPSDQRFDVDELVRAETPAVALFDTERATLPALWKALELPSAPPATPPALPALAPLRSLVHADHRLPGAIDLGRSIDIGQLAPELQTVARRVQLVRNQDASATTISLADVDGAVAHPGPFTPEDVKQLPRVRDALELLLRKDSSALEPRVRVPRPGVTHDALPAAGSCRLELESTITIRDQQAGLNIIGPEHSKHLTSFAIQRSQEILLTVPAGAKAVLLSDDGKTELLLREGTHRLGGPTKPLTTPNFRLELWRDGQRVENTDIILPSLRYESLDLRRFAGAPLVTADGTRLERYESRVGHGEYADPSAPPPAHRPQGLDRTPTRSFTANLPPGVYKKDGVEVRVWNPHLVSVVKNGSETFLQPVKNGRVGFATHETRMLSPEWMQARPSAQGLELTVDNQSLTLQQTDRIA